MPDLASLLTPAIALLAVVIAWAQWYTARSKLVLDLFKERMEVYTGVRKVMGRVMQHGTADVEDIANFSGPQDQARFVFGKDVSNYLQELRKTLANLGYCRSIMGMNKGDEEYQKAVELNYKSMLRVGDFYKEFGALLSPYMRMDHKRPMLWVSEIVGHGPGKNEGEKDNSSS
jgi:hypothetical protein